MATIAEMYNNWCLEELRWETQVNNKVWLAWFNKGFLIFQKMILEYVSGKHSTSVAFADISKGEDEYPLPIFNASSHVEDFYSIVQLRVAYHTDKRGNPIYRICKPIDFGDYNIKPLKNYPATGDVEQQWGRQVGGPYVWGRISEIHPRYIFVPHVNSSGEYSNRVKIFPTPTEDVDKWLTLTYNFLQQTVTFAQAFPSNLSNSLDLAKLNLPWYFFDAIEDYITFRLYQAENPEMAQWYYQQFEQTLHDNIYGMNKDKRPIEEWFANTTYFSHY